jgi:HK97 family phage major capsid protein
MLLHLLIALVVVAMVLAAAWSFARSRSATPKVHPLALELANLVNPFDSKLMAEVATARFTNVGTAEADLKDKIKKIDAELTEKRDERVEAQKELDSATEAYAKTDEPLSQDTAEFKAAKEARGKVGAIDDRIAELTAIQNETLRLLGKDAPEATDPQRTPAGDPTDPRADWTSAQIFQDQTMRDALVQMSASKAKIGPLQLGEVASRDALVADVTGSANMRRSEYQGVLPQLRRMLRVLDLLPTGPMDGNSIPYTEESGSLDTAAETAEGVAKPEGAWVPTDKTADAQTIAHWLKIRKQVLADFPALRTIIDGRLRYGVERRLEGQVLSGDGAGSNLRGILNTAGIGAVAFNAAELPADQVLSAITSILLADALADGIVMHPTDWASALKQKADDGAGGGDLQYYSGGPFHATPQVMWGIPLIASKAVPQGTVLVGDFAIGATLFIREGVNVLISDSDQDDFVKNKVTLLAEMRAALAVWRPPAFCTVDLTA